MIGQSLARQDLGSALCMGVFTYLLLGTGLGHATAGDITFEPPYAGSWCDHFGGTVGVGQSDHGCSADEQSGVGEGWYHVAAQGAGGAWATSQWEIWDFWAMTPGCTTARINMTAYYDAAVYMGLASLPGAGCANGEMSVKISLRVQDMTVGSLVYSEDYVIFSNVWTCPIFEAFDEHFQSNHSFSPVVALDAGHIYAWSLWAEISAVVDAAVVASALSEADVFTIVQGVNVEFTDGPANDDCTDAILIMGDGTYLGSNVCATTDGEASCGLGGDPGYFDVWWRYVAPGTGNVTIDTCGSGFDTILSVHDSCGGPDSGRCNDDGCGLQSSVNLDVSAGSTYYIRVAGYDGDAGDIALHVSTTCPGAGDCCGANGTPGCEDTACCQAVCTMDPYCCDTEWDAQCADEAEDLCAGLCGCGNGICDPPEETCDSCPEDCLTGCGDGCCDGSENACNCPQDCFTPVCGDGCCNGTENACTCPQDGCAPFCGDGCCNGNENACTCPQEGCTPECGDGCCNGSETACTCPGDGCVPSCGDGCCNGNETQCTCPQDGCPSVCEDECCDPTESCDTCPADCDTGGVCCGDGLCDPGEDPCICRQDCQGCCADDDCDDGDSCTDDQCVGYTCEYDSLVPCCGDSVCEYGAEDHATCPADCYCGNGTCDADETTDSCPPDCDGGCTPFDMNCDGIVSIISDVPCFVECVYFGQCECCDGCGSDWCICAGDCNGDGFLSIVGDVPCFVDCVYFGNCGG